MEKTFNKEILFDNIYFLAKKRIKKIGELEVEAGVSPGYISRTSKEKNTKPSIDFVMNVAKILNVSLDAMLKINFTELTSTENFLLKFFQKLSEDTIASKLDWKRETAKELNNVQCDMNGNPEHPCFQVVDFYKDNKSEKIEHFNNIIFCSKSFDVNTLIDGDCFHLKLKDGAVLYIFNLSQRNHNTADKNISVKEMWMYSKSGLEFIYSTFGESKLATILESLYINIIENSYKPKVNSDVRYIIDAFMKNDMSDDENCF